MEDPDRTLNLAPPEWETARKSRNASRRIIVAAAACVGLWLVVVTGFLVALKLRDASLARLRTRVEVLEKPAGEVRVLQSRTKALEDYGDRSRSALELLRQISTDLPEGLTLSTLSFRKSKSVSLRGEAAAVNAVYDFFASMEKSGLYTTVNPEAVTRKSGAQARAEFRWSGTLPGGEATP
jgi:Tfp pilus assembly protein PilN